MVFFLTVFILFMTKYFRVSDIICNFRTDFLECGFVLFTDYPIHCGKEYAFAIISRLAKSLGNSIGITSTTIICERCLVYIYGPCFIPISDAHAISVMQSYGMTGVPFRGRPVLNAIRRAPRLSFILRFAD